MNIDTNFFRKYYETIFSNPKGFEPRTSNLLPKKSVSANNHIDKIKDNKTYNNFSRCRKSTVYPTAIKGKNSQKTRNRNILTLIKVI